MGVSNAPKGHDLFLENGWRHEVIATAGRWELRLYPERVPVAVHVTPKGVFLGAAAQMRRGREGWTVEGVHDILPRHAPFDDPRTAFEWWLTLGN